MGSPGGTSLAARPRRGGAAVDRRRTR